MFRSTLVHFNLSQRAVALGVVFSLSQAAWGQQFGITQDVNPAQVLGFEKCIECHAAEHKAWKASSHFTDTWAYLTKPDAQKIASKLGIASATSESTCTTCHGSQHSAGVFQVVSCESCHNAAGDDGGATGWFKSHSDFGAGLDPKDRASRGKETEDNYKKRTAACDAAGMRRSSDLFALAQNCLECHVVGSEDLVNKGGHPTQSKGFEFFEWSQGEVRHNYQADPSKNAEAASIWTSNRFHPGRTEEGHKRLMFVVGQMADLAVSLRNRAKVTSKGDFLKNTNDRIESAVKELGSVAKDQDIPEVKAVLSAMSAVEKTLKNVGADDATVYGALAAQVAEAGTAAAKQYDGNAWESIKLPRKSKGNAQP